MTFNPNIPLSSEQSKLLSDLQKDLSSEQIFWVSGYFAGVSTQLGINGSAVIQNNTITAPSSEIADKKITILYGSRTGNGESVAKMAQSIALESGFEAKLQNMETYPTKELKNEKNLLVIISTHGDGEPSFQAKEFYDFIHSKRAPKLDQLNYSVLALGDRTYLKFCQVGIEVDKQLESLGGQRVFDRVDCDVDFRQSAQDWIKGALTALGGATSTSNAAQVSASQSSSSVLEVTGEYSKSNPFHATVLDKTFLHGRDSDRQTIHVELSTEGSGLTYEPGDSLGIYATNSLELVAKLMTLLRFSPDTKVQTENGKALLHDLLIHKYELTNITADVIQRYVELTQNEELKAILTSTPNVKKFIYGKDVLDFFTQYPTDLTPEQLIHLLRKISPRLYSIASSPLAHPDEVHLTVGVVKYTSNNRDKTGLCSVFLSDRIDTDENAPVFIEKNNNFRLPQDATTPIIMVGAGTGIAPYRAFVEHRAELENPGKSWLFFGNRFSESEFLYQLEWQRFLKEGVLTKMSVAFSRDLEQKVYVQDRMLENSKELFTWLEEGAHFYVCGDMKQMATAVHQTLLQIIQTEGNLSPEQAEEYVTNLQKAKRYQTDVY
ncbi:MAG: assimilatory sulfite reductase (NADPH) flavoprotein subunit [Bacteroidales bacterium]|nr:assimilatory sulfite reductase (NADPH) flavoprotein subunit [Bacteroidales bacterium]